MIFLLRLIPRSIDPILYSIDPLQPLLHFSWAPIPLLHRSLPATFSSQLAIITPTIKALSSRSRSQRPFTLCSISFSDLPLLNYFIQMSFLLWCIVLSLASFFTGCISHGRGLDIQVINVGEELRKQILPLKMGQGIYSVHGLKESQWYEIKISYPASIPASFSIQLKSSAQDLWLNKNRRLLNTEKIIFKYDSKKLDLGHSDMYVLVTVEPAGVVAKPGVKESEFILFNIVCDELSLGNPHNAWWVGAAAILCLIIASVVPYFLPLQQLLKIQTSKPSYSTTAKVT